MNATASLTLDHGLTPAVLTGETILRALGDRPAGDGFLTQSDLAAAADRAPKNIGREIGQLVTAGLVKDKPAEWSIEALTREGLEAIGALNRAAGQWPSGMLFVPPALLEDNPLNPRKHYDADKLEGLADTIEADGRVIEPLSVSPVQPHGGRYIWAGHRRKRAAMIVEARFATRGDELPPGLAAGVPCVEREATPAESLFIAVVENGQRENLSPWEEARALAALADATGWSGRELARKTGLAPRLDEGDETGVRDVQEKIKVARTAPAELVEAHEAGAITWEQLRGALRTGAMPSTAAQPAPLADPAEPPEGDASQPPLIADEAPALDLNPRQRLMLLEIAHAARFHPDAMPLDADKADGGSGFAAAGKYWLDMDANGLQSLRLIDFKHQGRPYVRVTPKGVEWMVENIAAELEPAMRSAQLGVNPCFDGPAYLVDWLNPPPIADPAAPSAEATDAEADDDAQDAAALLADTVDALLMSSPRDTPRNPTTDQLSDLLTRTGSVGPFSIPAGDPGLILDAKGECVCVVDVDGRLPDDQARARAVIIAFALNRATGVTQERV